jgi:hypothetical protein
MAAPASTVQTTHPAVRWRFALLAAAALALSTGLYLVLRITSNSPVIYAAPEEHFKYGSTGGEILDGIPYSVWMALPDLFPEFLPGKGYASLGFLYEKGKDLPIGVSKREVQGVDRVFFNCAICHVASFRKTPESEPQFIAGAPSNTVDLRAFYEFVFNAASDQKFTPPLILAQIEKSGIREDLLNQLIFRIYAIYAVRDSLLEQKQRLTFILKEPEFGPGRIDTFSPAKALLNFRMDNAPDSEGIGTTDLPSIWNQRRREGMQLHWDGNNTKVQERNRSAAFGTGAYPPTLDRDNMKRVEDWIAEAKPPKFPYAIDESKSHRGAQIYAELCANCHGPDGQNFQPNQGLLGTVTPIEKIATDRHRLDSYTYDLAVNQNLLYAGTKDPSERFSNFRKTYGYANMPLDGLWLRAPYLHNGSVPTLRDLFEPSAARPPKFYRGDDVYDPVRVGFVSQYSTRGERKLFPYDTSVPGNGNQGHEGKVYGTELAAADKDALVEFLKTF